MIRCPVARCLTAVLLSVLMLGIVGGALQAAPEPLAFVHTSDLFVDPRRASTVYASFWIYGVYKSVDYGVTWLPVNRGFKNVSVYALALSARHPDVLYAGTHAGGMYRSTNGGEQWREINTGLTTGTIWDLAVEPGNPERVYALTSQGLYRSADGGSVWTLLPGGIPGAEPDQQMTLFADTAKRFTLWLQNGGRLYRWTEPGWSPAVLSDITTIRATPLAVDPKSHALFAGTLKGTFRSEDGGAIWKPVSSGPPLPNWMVFDPVRPGTLIVGSDGKGMFRSTDGGKSFVSVNQGLIGPTSLKIFGLAVDPTDGKRLYAASHSIGLFRSEDGGTTWIRPREFPIPPVADIAAAAKAEVEAAVLPSREIPPPPEDVVIACNRCHGWTDPLLDRRSDAVWRAVPTPRNWTETVSRMAALAGLTQEQTATMTAYLNRYFGMKEPL